MAAQAAARTILALALVAVVGASGRSGSLGAHLFENGLKAGLRGVIHAVNLRRGTVQGVPARRSVLDIPGQVDLAVVAVPSQEVLSVARDCAAIGVSGMVVMSAGFAESGAEGAERQRELVRICRAAGMRLVGSNSMGVVNMSPRVRLHATFASLRPRPVRRPSPSRR